MVSMTIVLMAIIMCFDFHVDFSFWPIIGWHGCSRENSRACCTGDRFIGTQKYPS